MQSPQSLINQEMIVDSNQPIHFTAKQVIGWIIAATITITGLAYGAGIYSAEFTQIKKDVAEGKDIAKQLTIEIRLLREEVQKLNVNKR